MSHPPIEDTPDGGYGWICVVSHLTLHGFTWGIVAVMLSHCTRMSVVCYFSTELQRVPFVLSYTRPLL